MERASSGHNEAFRSLVEQRSGQVFLSFLVEAAVVAKAAAYRIHILWTSLMESLPSLIGK